MLSIEILKFNKDDTMKQLILSILAVSLMSSVAFANTELSPNLGITNNSQKYYVNYNAKDTSGRTFQGSISPHQALGMPIFGSGESFTLESLNVSVKGVPPFTKAQLGNCSQYIGKTVPSLNVIIDSSAVLSCSVPFSTQGAH